MCIMNLRVLMRMEIEEPSIPAFRNSTGICKQAMGARNRVGIWLSYPPPGYLGWQN